jgi:hypothetical protein
LIADFRITTQMTIFDTESGNSLLLLVTQFENVEVFSFGGANFRHPKQRYVIADPVDHVSTSES